MATVRSLFDVSGNIGDVSMYTLAGKKYIRRATTLSADDIRSRPSFKRTRENMQEFGGAGRFARELRLGLSAVVKRYGDSRLYSRLQKVFTKLLKMSPGIRGQRPVDLVTHSQFLIGFPLNRGLSLDAVLQSTFVVTPNSTRNGVTLVLPAVNPDADLSIPEGATHYKVLVQVLGISNLVFDTDIMGYVPLNPAMSGAKALVDSGYFSVSVPMAAPLTLLAELPGLPAMTADDSLVALVGVEFYQEVSGTQWLLAAGNAMDIVAIA